MLRSVFGLASVALILAACGASNSASTTSPFQDRTAAYIGLVHAYHDKYVAARGDGYTYCVVEVDAPRCGERGAAMIAVWQQFLKDLDRTPAPPRFAPDDRTVRGQLPKGIGDLQAMVVAAGKGDKDAVLAAANQYISDMVPTVTDALGDVYAPWRDE